MVGNNGRRRRYTVDTTPAARRQIARLPRADLDRVEAAIYSLQYDPRPPGSRKLRGAANRWRIHVRDLRVIYRILRSKALVVVVRVARRSERTYRDL